MLTQTRFNQIPRFITAVLVTVTLSMPIAAPAVEAILTDDAYTDQNNPAVNYGASQHIVNDQSVFHGLIKFDLSTLPAGTLGSDVANANLKLFVNAVAGSGEFLVAPALSPWDEDTVTAATLPGIAVTLTSPTVTQANKFVVVDVTPFVVDWLDGVSDNNGFIIEIPSPTVLDMRLDSKENRRTSHEPKLEIVLN